MKKIYKIVYICILFFVVTASLQAQCTFTTSVPYYEGFHGITTPSPLPQCWSTLGQAATSTTPVNKYAYFYYTPAGSNYFFTQGVQLNSGVNYSVSVWHIINNTGTSNWTNLSILLGTSQTTTGLTTLATTPGAASSPVWVALTNTFNVSTSGIYYFVIRGTSNGLLNATHLFLDDFEVKIPCSINPVNVTVTPSSTRLCQGASFTLTASGANTYLWSTGATTSSIVISPNSSTIYNVIGTNTLTGCNSINTPTSSILVGVNPSPILSVFANAQSVCLGSAVNLIGVGANTYTWSNGITGNIISVSPSVNTIYTVTGSNAFGCFGTAVQQIVVNPLPTITIAASNSSICRLFEPFTLWATGANSFTWNSPFSTSTGSVLSIPVYTASTTFTVYGTNSNGCMNEASLFVQMLLCAGLEKINKTSLTNFFPNPVQKNLSIEGLISNSTIEISDIDCKLIYASKVEVEKTTIDLSNLTKGIYFLKIKSGNEVLMKKILKE